MWKLLTAVCLGTAGISHSMIHGNIPVPRPRLRPPIPQINIENVVPKNPSIYQYNTPIYPQISPHQQHPVHCENSEILLKIWTIFLNLLVTGGEVKNPDVEKVKLAFKLIKEYIEKAPQNAGSYEVADKLLRLEEALLKNKDTAPESKRAFNTDDDNVETNDAVVSFKHKLPENVQPNCIDELAKVIQTAQKSYLHLTLSPICNGFVNPDDFLRRSDIPVTLINPANFRNQFKQADIKNLNANNNDALKASLALLMNQTDYNAHDVFELLQNYKPIQTTKSPLVDAIQPVVNNSYNRSQLSDIVANNDWTNDSQATKIDPLNPNEIELTYALKRPQPRVYQPYYFIKYRLPFNSFLQNLGQVTQQKSIDTSKSELYKSVIQSWNADEVSPDLAHFTKEQVNDLVIKEGNLVEALLIQSKSTSMRINLNTPENLEDQLGEYNFDKGKTENDGKHLIKVQVDPYQTGYSSDRINEGRRRFEPDLRPGLDAPPRLPRYPSMFQKGPPPSPLKGFSDHLLYKTGFGKSIPTPNLPSPLIE